MEKQNPLIPHQLARLFSSAQLMTPKVKSWSLWRADKLFLSFGGQRGDSVMMRCTECVWPVTDLPGTFHQPLLSIGARSTHCPLPIVQSTYHNKPTLNPLNPSIQQHHNIPANNNCLKSSESYAPCPYCMYMLMSLHRVPLWHKGIWCEHFNGDAFRWIQVSTTVPIFLF